MEGQVEQRYSFGPFLLDPVEKVLLRDGHPVALPPKALETLLALVGNHGHLMEKAELLHRVWPDTFVEEATLAQNIFTLRKILSDSTEGPLYIETVPRRGYRFIAPINGANQQRGGAGRAGSGFSRVRPSREVLWWAAVILVVCVGVGAYLRSRHLGLLPAPPTSKFMLAVLPFENLTGDPQQEYFSDGLTEELITQLGGMNPQRLAVIARTSVMHYRKTSQTVAQIGQELGVDYVVEGSVVREKNLMRISSQLVRVRDQTHVWAHSYERDLGGVLALQDEVAAAIAQSIEITLASSGGPRGTGGRTVNPAAYESYLQGRYFWNRRTEEGYKKALQYFNEAIREDPNYAQAYAGLADTFALLGSLTNSVLPRSEAMPKARQAALRALELNDRLAEAHTSLAFVKMQYDREWAVAEREFQHAIQLNAGYATAHHWYAYLLMSQGRTQQALSEIQLARESDPLSLVINSDVGEMYYYAHQFDRAIQQYRKTLEMDPNFLPAYWQLASAYVHSKRYPEAIDALRHAADLGGNRPETTALLGYVYAVSGQREEAEKRLTELLELSRRRPDVTQSIPLVYAGLGKTDQMFANLEKACQERTGSVILIKADPALDALHADPRYAEAVRCVGLTP